MNTRQKALEKAATACELAAKTLIICRETLAGAAEMDDPSPFIANMPADLRRVSSMLEVTVIELLCAGAHRAAT